jgi:hypothetical protein
VNEYLPPIAEEPRTVLESELKLQRAATTQASAKQRAEDWTLCRSAGRARRPESTNLARTSITKSSQPILHTFLA